MNVCFTCGGNTSNGSDTQGFHLLQLHQLQIKDDTWKRRVVFCEGCSWGPLQSIVFHRVNPYTLFTCSYQFCNISLYWMIWIFIKLFPSHLVWISSITLQDKKLSLTTKESHHNLLSRSTISEHWNQAQKHLGVKVCSKRLQKPKQSCGFRVDMQVMMEILGSRSEYVRSCWQRLHMQSANLNPGAGLLNNVQQYILLFKKPMI